MAGPVSRMLEWKYGAISTATQTSTRPSSTPTPHRGRQTLPTGGSLAEVSRIDYFSIIRGLTLRSQDASHRHTCMRPCQYSPLDLRSPRSTQNFRWVVSAFPLQRKTQITHSSWLAPYLPATSYTTHTTPTYHQYAQPHILPSPEKLLAGHFAVGGRSSLPATLVPLDYNLLRNKCEIVSPTYIQPAYSPFMVQRVVSSSSPVPHITTCLPSTRSR